MVSRFLLDNLEEEGLHDVISLLMQPLLVLCRCFFSLHF